MTIMQTDYKKRHSKKNGTYYMYQQNTMQSRGEMSIHIP